jgi:hypothetical protein
VRLQKQTGNAEKQDGGKAAINRHFRFEGKLMLAVVLLPLIVGIVAALVLPNVLSWLEGDRCMNAGGQYDRENGRCVVETKR